MIHFMCKIYMQLLWNLSISYQFSHEMSLIFQKISQRLIQEPDELKLFFNMERYETLLWLQQNHSQSHSMFFAQDMLKT